MDDIFQQEAQGTDSYEPSFLERYKQWQSDQQDQSWQHEGNDTTPTEGHTEGDYINARQNDTRQALDAAQRDYAANPGDETARSRYESAKAAYDQTQTLTAGNVQDNQTFRHFARGGDMYAPAPAVPTIAGMAGAAAAQGRLNMGTIPTDIKPFDGVLDAVKPFSRNYTPYQAPTAGAVEQQSEKDYSPVDSALKDVARFQAGQIDGGKTLEKENTAWQDQYAVPDWQSKMTKLSPQEEAQFQDWAKQTKAPITPDYDMRGFWKDPNSKTAIDPNDGLVHYSDTYKTPLHETFSRESVYATPDAPQWVNDRFLDDHGTVRWDDAFGRQGGKVADYNNQHGIQYFGDPRTDYGYSPDKVINIPGSVPKDFAGNNIADPNFHDALSRGRDLPGGHSDWQEEDIPAPDNREASLPPELRGLNLPAGYRPESSLDQIRNANELLGNQKPLEKPTYNPMADAYQSPEEYASWRQQNPAPQPFTPGQIEEMARQMPNLNMPLAPGLGNQSDLSPVDQLRFLNSDSVGKWGGVDRVLQPGETPGPTQLDEAQTQYLLKNGAFPPQAMAPSDAPQLIADATQPIHGFNQGPGLKENSGYPNMYDATAADVWANPATQNAGRQHPQYAPYTQQDTNRQIENTFNQALGVQDPQHQNLLAAFLKLAGLT